MRVTPRNAFVAVGTFGLMLLIWSAVMPSGGLLPLIESAESVIARARAREIEEAFDHAWNGYTKYCMGRDSLHPVSNTCSDEFGGWGATAIDALTTAILMRKEDAVIQILHFVQDLDLSRVKTGQKAQLFEDTIRHLGAMISAWDLLHGPFADIAPDASLRRALYSKMIRLGDGLSCAFKTPTGIPRDWVYFDVCETDDGRTTSIAGAGTLILEFARLSEITGNRTYGELAQRAEQYLLKPQPSRGEPFPGLLGTFIDVSDGQFVDSQGSWGGSADSFYEYLIKAYVYDSRTFEPYLARWKVAADSTIRFIASHPYGHPEWTLLPHWQGAKLSNNMDSLSWFAGGSFILGGATTRNKTLLDFGISIADTAGALYNSTATGLAGEIMWWTTDCGSGWGEEPCGADNSVRFSTTSYQMRPEALETWYYAYRATKDRKYQEWAWSMFQGLVKYCKTDSGFSSISDVTDPDGGYKTDMQESFVFAEIFKYMYLIFNDNDRLAYHVHAGSNGVKNSWVFNTEAHPFRVVGPHV